MRITIVGVNYYGMMASSQRVRNLFKPLLSKEGIVIKNLVINESNSYYDNGDVKIKNLKYNIHNPLSILFFIISSVRYFSKNYRKEEKNIIYHYGYPSIEDILFLKYSKWIGYRVVFDIVENITFFDNKKGSYRIKIKNWSSRKMLNQIYKTGSKCFGISYSLVDYCKQICKDKIPVVFLPISVDINYVRSFKNANNQTIADSDESAIKIFYGGSFGFKDGFEFLIKGFEMACEIDKRIELVLTGIISKQTSGVIQNLISDSKWSNRIKYLGCLSEEEYFSAITNSDILCVPRVNTNYANSGFPFKLGEYLASGNAVIATNVGEVNKYLENNKNAVVIHAESENEICNAILSLANDRELREKIGNAGMKTALKYFSSNDVSSILWDNFVDMN